ncbi:MAG TPA: carboxypeptidase regulatory-like domain-containing protein [Bryobacteraceae bacterium]|nr:carboxypeptidase regulatory-like domain-containing protein [Bryobacteraceae bacterium]
MKKLALSCVAAMLLCLALPNISLAQVNGTVGGTVSDSSGAIIPKVTVTAKNDNTGVTTTAVTNDSGAYEFSSLQPGTYTVSAANTGFQTATFKDVALGQGQQVRLNFGLKVAAGAQSVDVVVEADTQLATTTSSVGGVLTTKEVNDLPIASRNVLDLVALTPGVINVPGVFTSSMMNFAGLQTNQVNTTRDGVVTNDGRYANGAYSGAFTSPDLIEEIRVSTNQIDPALGRGAAQVELRTRSGGNDYHGALFWSNNNSYFNAAPFFQNLNAQPNNFANRNQYGGRVGGPIKKNKLFFFFVTDDQRYLGKQADIATVLTASARQGIFRYLTTGSAGGTARTNGNAFAGATASVDTSGNPLASSNGTPLYLNSVNLFAAGAGPNFTAIDPVWFGPQYVGKYMPLPNNYSVGDGLNTAGFAWQQRLDGLDGATGQSPNNNRNNFSVRLDYNINDRHKVNFIMTREHDWGATTQTGIPDYPTGVYGQEVRDPRFYSANWTWTITPTLLNEFHFGFKQDTWEGTSPLDNGCCIGGASETAISDASKAVRASYPQANGTFLYTQAGTLGTPGGTLGLYAGMNVSAPRTTVSPFYQWGDSVSWVKGKHSFRFGFEIDRTSSISANSGNSATTRPSVTLGAGVAPPVFTPALVPGIGPTNQTTAQNLLANLVGEVASVSETYWINSATQQNWTDYTSDILFYRTNVANAWSAYGKDNWKVSPNITVNAGLRFDFFGAPYMQQGLAGRPQGGQSGLFGISGTNFANAMWKPGASAGSITTAQFVGPNSPNPDLGLYNNYWKDFGPTIGIAWNIPWLKNTVFRAGYGINYIGNVDFLTVNTGSGAFPGQTLIPANPVSGFTTLSQIGTAGIVPVPTGGTLPLAPIPVNAHSNTTVYGYDDNLRTPYIQSFNATLQKQVTSTISVDVNYIGNKGSRLYVNQQLDDTNIFENGFLPAFNAVRGGGDSPLFDQMLNGITIPGVGTINNTTLTGSQALRSYASTNQFLANGSIGSLANFLNTTSALGGGPGGVLTHAGLPANFFTVNPQFTSVYLINNDGNSTYHSFQAHIAKRLSHGVTGQFSYTFSKALGDTISNGAYRDPRDFAISKSLLSIDRPELFQGNVTWALPLGRGQDFLKNIPTWLDEVVGGWNVSGSYQWQSGAPLTFTAGAPFSYVTTLSNDAANTANLVGTLPSDMSHVVKGANGVISYFQGLTVQTIPTSQLASLGVDSSLASRYTNLEVVNAQGQPVLVDPQPGTTGNTAFYTPGIRGPSLMGINMSASKILKIRERYSIILRADAVNVTNTPQWGYSSNPSSGTIGLTTNINSTSFGKITSAAGNRIITFNARFEF